MIFTWILSVLAVVTLVQLIRMRHRSCLDRLRLDLDVEHELRVAAERSRDEAKHRQLHAGSDAVRLAQAEATACLHQLQDERQAFGCEREKLQQQVRDLFCRLADVEASLSRAEHEIAACRDTADRHIRSLVAARASALETSRLLSAVPSYEEGEGSRTEAASAVDFAESAERRSSGCGLLSETNQIVDYLEGRWILVPEAGSGVESEESEVNRAVATD